MGVWTAAQLKTELEGKRASAIVDCRLLRPLAGGVPATDDALRAFIEHHMGLTGDEAESTYKRIRGEEVRKEDKEKELIEQEVYAVNVLRRSERGPFILQHMVKAMLKQAASRLGIFAEKRGTKGDMAEMGAVLAHGMSLVVPERPWEIYLVDDKRQPVATKFEVNRGSVQGPKGRVSIQTHTETAPEGTRFAFEFRWLPAKLTEAHVVQTIAAIGQIGIGSCKSLDYATFVVERLETRKAGE